MFCIFKTFYYKLPKLYTAAKNDAAHAGGIQVFGRTFLPFQATIGFHYITFGKFQNFKYAK